MKRLLTLLFWSLIVLLVWGAASYVAVGIFLRQTGLVSGIPLSENLPLFLLIFVGVCAVVAVVLGIGTSFLVRWARVTPEEREIQKRLKLVKLKKVRRLQRCIDDGSFLKGKSLYQEIFPKSCSVCGSLEFANITECDYDEHGWPSFAGYRHVCKRCDTQAQVDYEFWKTKIKAAYRLKIPPFEAPDWRQELGRKPGVAQNGGLDQAGGIAPYPGKTQSA